MGARPDFRLPFAVGARVALKTYVGHDPDDKKIDMYRDGMPTGSPIVASADGVVHEWVDPGGIEIDHGGGWFTLYLHMTSRARVGSRVARGDYIGTMGSVGTHSPHPHYEQLYDPSGDGDAESRDIVNPVLQGVGPIVMDPAKPISMISTNGEDVMTQPLPLEEKAPSYQYAIWRMEGLANFRDTYAGGPEAGKPIELVRQLKLAAVERAAILSAIAGLAGKVDALAARPAGEGDGVPAVDLSVVAGVLADAASALTRSGDALRMLADRLGYTP